MNVFFKNTLFAVVVATAAYACKGNADKKADNTTVIKLDSFKINIDSSARKTERTVKASKSETVDPQTQDSIIIEDSVIHSKTVIKHSPKK